jgi:hypothetical protein
MAMTCRRCGGPVRANKEKLAVVLGGTAAMMLIGLMLATPVGWLALIPAALAGSKQANQLLQMKIRLAHASQRAGGYFWCDDCQRDVPLDEVFGD